MVDTGNPTFLKLRAVILRNLIFQHARRMFDLDFAGL